MIASQESIIIAFCTSKELLKILNKGCLDKIPKERQGCGKKDIK